ncbi:RHS repeat-associated core domain-containing protein [Streptomyces sp. SID13666]|uniref:RHS repeat domain-containing protein n=1 Tax=unclassified Streptomyces TaxID=2593676 RepID=UPI0013BF536A|nr:MULTISPECIES: RHS repeat-associated core domain-containing protein [unclassified Streptomyces]NEA54277.1 RHS repeat-associated core domain-containing protein [Streptomyces sp. SID13666]NEA70372.1 RHS repeat-associated core domain-containing protein [Streptomyces sp. SID13588]
MTLGPVGTAAKAGRTTLTLDYSGFARAAGAGYGSRLRLVQLPACALTHPERTECRQQTPLAGANDSERQTISADAVTVPAAATSRALPAAMGGVTVLAATATTSGPSGDYKASPLSSASTWKTGLNSGSFSWSYNMPVPQVPNPLSPKLDLSYSSGAVDGRTANSNNQSSWAGDGFDIAPGFVERSYKPCGDDGVKTNDTEPGDLCWGYDNATIDFNGHSGELIAVSADEWRIKGDDGTKVTRAKDLGRGNGDNDGEYFKAVTKDGTQYFFGYNRLPNWASGKAETQSVYTVPVFGNDAGEPCHGSSFATSWCQQGWRWNLDLVLDVHGNDITYWYHPESNSYGRNLTDTDDTPYVRGGTLDHIEYGQQKSDIYSATVKPMARVDFSPAERCLESTTVCDPATIDANRQYWYDTPWDMNCAAGQTCDSGRLAPTFWTRTRLAKVTARTLQSDGGYKDVDSWALHYHWGTADSDYQLLLDSILHTGLAGTPSAALPATTFGYDQRPNRLDRTGDGRSAFIKERLGTVDDELGGQLDINYSAAACDANALPTPQANTTRCFPQKYRPGYDSPVTTEWFNKYVVDSVLATDRTGGAPDMVTRYTYLDGAAWHFDDDDGLTKDALKTWSQWHGYGRTRVQTGGTQRMSTQTDHYFLRGMDGDRSDPADKSKTRSVRVPNGEGSAVTDDPAWAGYEYRTEYDTGPDGPVLIKSVNTPWKEETAKRIRDWGTTTADLVATSVARAFTSLDNGAGATWREVRVNTTLDANARAVQVESLGDVGIAGDDTCARSTYADNTTDWIFTAAIHSETVAGNCSAAVNRDTRPDGSSAVLSDSRTRYDGQSYGKAPIKGLATMTEALKSRSGNTAIYLDNTAAYDAYGRQIATTALASTSVFNPSSDAVAPITTAVANPRTTTTAYTPATGRPTKAVVTTPPAKIGTAASAQSITTEYDPLRGLAAATVDINGLRTDFQFDALGRYQKVWQPNRSKSSGQSPNFQFTYNSQDGAIRSLATASVNNDGSQETAYTLFDGFGRKRQTQTRGDGGGRILTDTFYDERGLNALAYSSYYATGVPTGTLFKIEDATGVETQNSTQFDGLGRPTKITQLAGNGVGTPLWTTTRVYGGDRLTVTPPKGSPPTTTLMDAAGRATELRQYKDGTATGAYDSTAYDYDAAGRLTTLTDPSHTVWSWTYDQFGRQVKAVDPDSGTTSKAYNDRGELVTTQDNRGKVVAHIYDNLSRQIETRDGSVTGAQLTSQSWDPAGNKGEVDSTVRYVTVSGATYQYKVAYSLYDALYRPQRTTVTVPSLPGQEGLAGVYTTGSTYNLDGTTKSVAYPAAGHLPAESVAFTYDALHRPVGIGGNLSTYLTGQTFSLTGKPLKSTLNAGAKKTWITNSYEWGTQRLSGSRTDQEDVAGAARATSYSYDETGNVTSLTDSSRTGTDRQCFTYDYQARLTTAFTPSRADCSAAPDASALAGPAPYWSSYTYNTDGTRHTQTQHDTDGDSTQDKSSTYTYPAPGAAQPHSLSATSTRTDAGGTPVDQNYVYDASGNTIERHLKLSPATSSDQLLTWDTEGHLAKATSSIKTGTSSSTKTTDYVYAADGTRLLQHSTDTAVPAAENTTLYFGTTELNLVKGAAKPTATRYYPLGSATAVRTDDNKVVFQIADSHGTADASIDAASGLLTQRRESPFGEDRGAQPASWAGTKSFVGGVKDTGTGLIHLGAREYDPATGRFLSVDPLLAADDVQSLNGYVYSHSNPLTRSDPTGQYDPDERAYCTSNPTQCKDGRYTGGGVPEESAATVGEPDKADSGARKLTTRDGRVYRLSNREINADPDEKSVFEYLNAGLKDSGKYSEFGDQDGVQYVGVLRSNKPGVRTADMVRLEWKGGKVVEVTRVDIVTRMTNAVNGAVMRLKDKAGQLGKDRQSDSAVVNFKGVSAEDASKILDAARDQGVDMDAVRAINTEKSQWYDQLVELKSGGVRLTDVDPIVGIGGGGPPIIEDGAPAAPRGTSPNEGRDPMEEPAPLLPEEPVAPIEPIEPF